MIEHAHSEIDLRIPPSNHLEMLKGNLKGLYSRLSLMRRLYAEN